MQSDSNLMNQLAHRTNYLRQLTDEESVLLKQTLLTIYRDVATLCHKHGLTMMLCGGSCLGAVRHQGFIPWDDDLDIMMPRKDYDRLIQLLQDGALGEGYEYSAPDKHKDAGYVFLKIYKKDTVNTDIFSHNSPFPHGVSIDVFALDAVPRTRIAQYCKGLLANALQFISIMVLYAQYPSRSLREFLSLDRHLYRRYRIKVAIGTVLKVIPHRLWVWWFDRLVSSTRTDIWGIPTGRKYYNGEIFSKEVFLPTRAATFEGIEVQIPNDYDAYLSNLYHDYMQLPPEAQRERHFFIEFHTA